MVDRELLELAAKASGVQGRFIERTPEDGAPAYSCGIGNAGRITPLWNPLTDDGDALRLAVKLGLWEAVRDGYQHLDSDGDPYAATRRAIVRAAAEIGKEMLGV